MIIAERWRRWHIGATAAAVLSLWMIGCGERPEVRLEQARLAMSHEQYERAAALAAEVIRQQPMDLEAAEIRFEACLRLNDLSGARSAVDAAVTRHPDAEQPRSWALRWAWRKLGALLSRSHFADDPTSQTQFEEIIGYVIEQADWLAANGQEPRAMRVRARAAATEGDGLQRQLDQVRQKDEMRRTLHSEGAFVPSPRIAALDTALRVQLDKADRLYRQAIAMDPTHESVRIDHLKLLRFRRDWDAIWRQSLGALESQAVRPALVDKLVEALLEMPSAVRTRPERLELGWRLVNAVKPEDQADARWLAAGARLHQYDGAFAEAEQRLRTALEHATGPVVGDVRFLLAYSLLQQGRLEEAAAITGPLARRWPGSARIIALHGAVLARLGDLRKARETLRQAIDLDPHDQLAREEFLRLLAEQGHFHEARFDIDQYLSHEPEHPAAFRVGLQFAMATGDRARIINLLGRMERLNDITPEHMRLLVEGYRHLQDHRSVRRWAAALVNAQPEQITNFMALAEAFVAAGQDENARQVLIRGRSHSPEAPPVDQLLGQVYLDLQRYDQAAGALENVLADEPDNHTARTRLASALAARGQLDAAAGHLDRVLRAEPDNLDALSLAVRIALSQGDRQRAGALLSRVSPDDVPEDRHPVLKARLLLARGQTDEAMTICHRAVIHGRRDAMLRPLLASLHENRGEFDQAERQLLAQVHLQPRDLPSYLALAAFYVRQQDVNAGLDTFNALYSVNETLARMGQAAMLENVGQADLASLRLEPMLRRLADAGDPRALTVARTVARLARKTGDLDRAVTGYQTLIDSNVKPGWARVLLIDVLIQAQRSADASRTLQAFAAQDSAIDLSADLDLAREVFQRFAVMGMIDQGLTLAARLERAGGPAVERFARLERARLLGAGGDHTQAITVYQQLLAEDPADLDVAEALAAEAVVAGHPPIAEAAYRLIADRHPDRAAGDGAAVEGDVVDYAARAHRLALARRADEASLRLAEMYRSLGLPRQVIDFLADRLPAAPASADAPSTAPASTPGIAVDEADPQSLAMSNPPGSGVDPDAMAPPMTSDAGIPGGDEADASAATRGPDLSTMARTRGLLLLADAAIALGREDEAVHWLSMTPEASPLQPTARLMLAWAHLRAGRPFDAQTQVHGVLADDRAAEQGMRTMLQIATREPVTLIAPMIEWADQASPAQDALSPAVSRAWLRLRVRLAIEQKQWRVAGARLEQLAAAAPANEAGPILGARYLLAFVQDDEEQAARLHELLHARNQSTPVFDAIAGKSRVYESAPPMALWWSALIRREAGIEARARDAVQPSEYLHRDDLASDARAVRALTQVAGGQAKQRQEKQMRALRQAAMAFEALRLGLPELAQTLAAEAVRADGSLIMPYSLWLHALHRLGQPTDAALAQLQRQAPGSSLALYWQAVRDLERERFDQALPMLERLHERDRTHAAATIALSRTLAGLDRTDQAIDLLRAAAAPDQPQRLAVINDLALLLAEHRPDARNQATALLTEALAAMPAQPALLDSRGWIHHLAGRDTAALADLTAAVRLAPQAGAVHYHLGRVYQSMGQLRWARLHLEAAAHPVQGAPVPEAAARLDAMAAQTDPQSDAE